MQLHRPYLLYLILGGNSTLAVDFSRDRMLVDLLCQGIGQKRLMPFLYVAILSQTSNFLFLSYLKLGSCFCRECKGRRNGWVYAILITIINWKRN